jgi:rubrerythrin
VSRTRSRNGSRDTGRDVDVEMLRIMLWVCGHCHETFSLEWSSLHNPAWCPFCGLVTDSEVRPMSELEDLLDKFYFDE